VHASALQAAKRGGRPGRRGLSGADGRAHLEGFYNEASVNVNAAEQTRGPLDIDTACRLAMAKEFGRRAVCITSGGRSGWTDAWCPIPNTSWVSDWRWATGRCMERGQIGDHIHVITGFNLRVATGFCRVSPPAPW